jgi:hypothetical protein
LALGLITTLAAAGIGLRSMIKPDKSTAMFQALLYALVAHMLMTGVGRYMSEEKDFMRYFYIYAWIMITMSVLIGTLYRKTLVPVCITIILLATIGGVAQLPVLAKERFEYARADVNIINNSFAHFTYKKLSFPHVLLNSNPARYYNEFLKEKGWGIYSDYDKNPDIGNLGNDSCSAVKTGQFLLSEREFTEYRLSGKNNTRNTFFENVYAINQQGEIVARGKTQPNKPSLKPNWLLKDHEAEIYLMLSRDYRLKTVALIGETDGVYCRIDVSLKQ